MKNPALARVMAIVLAILSLVMLLAGIFGISNAVADRDESVRANNVLEGRIDTYKELSKKLENSLSYKEATAKYEEAKDEHQHKNSEHRSGLAEYTAAEGIIKSSKESMAMMDVIFDYAFSYIKNICSLALDEFVDSLEAIKTPNLSEDEYNELVRQIQDAGDDSTIRAIEDRISGIESSEEIDEVTMQDLSKYINAYIDSVTSSYVGLSDTVIPESVASEIDFYTQEAKNELDPVIQVYHSLMNLIDQYIDGKKQLTSAELENLKKGIELAVEKYELIRESEELAEQKAANEQLKEDENSLKSTKVHILKNEKISAAVDGGEDIVTAAERELSRATDESKKDFSLRLDANILLILGAIAGFLGIFGAFEIKKSRPWLIVPVALFALFAALADGISMYLGRGQMYSALASVVFGIVQLLIIVPKKKTLA